MPRILIALLLMTAALWAQHEADPEADIEQLRTKASAPELERADLVRWAKAYRVALDEAREKAGDLASKLEEAAEGEKAAIRSEIEEQEARAGALEERLRVFHDVFTSQQVYGAETEAKLDQVREGAEILGALGEKEVLAQWARAIQKQMQRLDEERKDLAEREASAAGEEKKKLATGIEETQAGIARLAKHARALRGPLGAVGLAELASQLSKLSIKVTGEVAIEDLSVDVAVGLLDEWIGKATDWVVEEGPGILWKVFLFLLILFVFRVLAGWAARLVQAALSRRKLKVSSLLRNFFVGITRKTIFIIGLLIALTQVGVNIGPFLAGLGVIGFVVGFALQGTLSNFASGIMILLYKPYDVGDVINAAGVVGKVDSMNLVSTTILTFDNQEIVVPNNSIWGGVITNITARDTRRVDMTFGVGYGDDLDGVEALLLDEIKQHPKVLASPEPVVKVSNLGESSVDFIARPWARTADYWDVFWDLQKSIKQRLDREGYSIPFPQRDLHIVSQPGAAE
jgi:small-conductance mechanosensitive channel